MSPSPPPANPSGSANQPASPQNRTTDSSPPAKLPKDPNSDSGQPSANKPSAPIPPGQTSNGEHKLDKQDSGQAPASMAQHHPSDQSGNRFHAQPSYPPSYPAPYHPSLPTHGSLPQSMYPYPSPMHGNNPSFPPPSSPEYSFRPYPSNMPANGFAVPGVHHPQQLTTSQPESSVSTPSQASPNFGTAPSPVAASPSTSSAPPAVKRKRKANENPSKTKGDHRTSDEEGDKNKRTKTSRACDPCRRKKIRCDVLADADPPVCQHCKQYGFECTFFLPISETRFKKKTMAEQAVAASSSVPTNGTPAPPKLTEPKPERTHNNSDDILHGRATLSPTGGSGGEVKIYGPTSLSFIMHSTPSLPVRTFESYDLRYHQTWEVGKSGDGFIQVLDPSPNPAATALPKPVEYRLDRETLATLINAYFKEVSPQFPIVSEAEFLSTTSPPPVLLYAVCSVAASRRGVPQEVFESLRLAVNQVIKAEDVLSTASIVNVQALLVLSMSTDVHSSSINNAMTAAWLRLGASIRMSQELGLYRAEAVKVNVELRRRLWGACVIADRWYGAAYGHPFMIDVLDCDVRLPTPDHPNDPATRLTKPNCYLAELIKLSILLGKVVKTIYSPSGLVHATDEILEDLLNELDQWKVNLHPDLAFQGENSILPAGLLHLFYTCVCMMFWRVFMRLSYSCPEHLKFSLSVPRWSELVKISRESIDWLDANESCYDVWMMVAYSACSCALIQYHTWARRRDPDASESLRKLKECVRRWEVSLQPGHLSARRKTAEIITLLYEATQIPEAQRLRPSTRPRLNPTVGVHDHVIGAETFRRLAFRKDPSRPGGGVFVADGAAVKEAVSDVPDGTVIVEAELPPTHSKSSGMSGMNGTDVNSAASSPTAPGPSFLMNLAPFQTNNQFGTYTGAHPFGGVGQMMNGSLSGEAAIAASNVNPVMNIGQSTTQGAGLTPNGIGATNQVTVLNFLDQQPVDSTGAYQMLDGIPVDMFSWDGWNEYFTRLSVPSLLAGQHPTHQANPAPSSANS